VIEEDHLKKAWISCRKFFPLVGAQVVQKGDDVSFVVDEAQLSNANPDNFEILQRSDDSQVDKIRESIINPAKSGKSRVLSNDSLTKLFIILSPPNNDEWLTHDIVFASCHFISDAAGTLSIARAFFEFLAGPQDVEEAESQLPTLEDRLGSVPAIEEVYPFRQRSRAASLWRWAIARIVYDLKYTRLQVGFESNIPVRAKS
jgi:hypothetical protein